MIEQCSQSYLRDKESKNTEQAKGKRQSESSIHWGTTRETWKQL